LIVNDILDVETFGCRPSPMHSHGSVNSSEVRNSQPYCEAKISFRGKDQFNNSSNIIDRRDSNI